MKRAVKTEDMADDSSSRTRVYFDQGPPEEYMAFEAAAKVILFDELTDASQEKKLKGMLGNHALGVAYAGRVSNYGNATSVFASLAASFGGKTAARARDELDRLRQGSTGINEHIATYNELSAQAQLTAAEKARQFRNTLNEGLRLVVISSGKQDFNEMAELARETAPLTERQYKRMTSKPTGRPGQGTRPERVNKVQGQPGKRPFGGTCYNCGKPGHMKRDCRSPAKEQGRRADHGPARGAAPAAEPESEEEEENP
jgi:hypothetical protein